MYISSTVGSVSCLGADYKSNFLVNKRKSMKRIIVINVHRKGKSEASERERQSDINIEVDDYRILYERSYVTFHNNSSLNLSCIATDFRIS
jgi:hypothetical protein